jgi:hypothetical protein
MHNACDLLEDLWQKARERLKAAPRYDTWVALTRTD